MRPITREDRDAFRRVMLQQVAAHQAHCASCDQNLQLLRTVVKCKGRGCGGVSLIRPGGCKLKKW